MVACLYLDLSDASVAGIGSDDSELEAAGG